METTYNPKQMLDTFWDAALILKRGVTERQHYNVRYNAVYANRPNDPYQLVAHTTASDHHYTRAWHAYQQQQHAIHPVVIKAMGMARPDD